MTPLSVHNLTVAYQQRVAVDNVSFDIQPGHIVALMGPNGAGKSTVLKAAVGLIPTADGAISFFDEKLSRVRQRVGYMPQTADVDWDFPTTVREVVMMGRYGKLGWFKRPKKVDRDAVANALESVGISDLARRHISQLSGGQKQRTFIARILAQDPDLFILDEPLAGVDMTSQETIIGIIKHLRNQGHTVVLVHHDLSNVADIADDIVLLRNGSLVKSGPANEALTKESMLTCYGRCSLDRLAA